MKTTRKSRAKTTMDTAAADRYILDNIRETEELLVSLGKMSTKDIEESQALRASVGAKPLRLSDASLESA
jgi:hypothetical protein